MIIRDHCDSLRHKVDIARETAIESIHKASNKLMAKIETFENKCLSSLAAKDSTVRVVEDVSARMRALLREQHAFLQIVQASDPLTYLLLHKNK